MDKNQEKMRAEYVQRINRVIDYIERNLQEELTLATLAGVAGFSPYHFHRVFGSMTGETLFGFIQRLRLEKAAQQLIACRNKTATAIAYDCGFSGSAVFSRSFREAFGMSPTEWRNSSKSKDCIYLSNTGKKESKDWKDTSPPVVYIETDVIQQKWRIEMIDKNHATIRVKELPSYNVAYVRHVGPYQGDVALFNRLYHKLVRWAAPRGLLNDPDAKFICVYHDDPGLTDESKLRTSVCLTVPLGTIGEGEVGTMTIPGGRFAVGHFEIRSEQFGDAWNLMCGGWMAENGYQPDDRLCYELCLNDPADHPEGKHIVDICVPVRPL